MRGLKSIKSWRTFLVGVGVGYVFAWKMHWAAQMWSPVGGWVDEYVPFITPKLGRHD